MPPKSSSQAAGRVLIVRLGAMGDVLHAMPAVAALRARRPECHIGWVIEPRWTPLLRTQTAAAGTAQQPLVDAVHVANARGWARQPLTPATWRAMRELRHELRAQRYDLAIDLQGAVRSALIGRASGARLTGEQTPRERPARWFFQQRIATTGVHVIEQAVEVAAAATGEPLTPLLPPLPVDDAAEARVARMVSASCPLALLHPGAGWGAKRWPAVRYGAVAAGLRACGYSVAVNRAPGEERLADEVVQASGGGAFAVTMDIAEMIAMTRRCALAIGGDTGPLHLACALGKPVIGIYGPTDPARNGPWGSPFRVLRHPQSRRDHSRRSAPEAGLLTIEAEEVLAAADELRAAAGSAAVQA